MINETIEDNLTNNLWQHWKHQGTQTKMTALEIHHLACAFTKICREANIDYQTVDFQSCIDSKLNYWENLSQLEDLIKSPVSGMTLDKAIKEASTFEELQQERDKLKIKVDDLKRKIKLTEENAELEKQRILAERNLQQPQPQTPTEDTAMQIFNACYERWCEQQIIEAYDKNFNPQKPAHPQKKSTAKNILHKTAKFLWKVIY